MRYRFSNNIFLWPNISDNKCLLNEIARNHQCMPAICLRIQHNHIYIFLTNNESFAYQSLRNSSLMTFISITTLSATSLTVNANYIWIICYRIVLSKWTEIMKSTLDFFSGSIDKGFDRTFKNKLFLLRKNEEMRNKSSSCC